MPSDKNLADFKELYRKHFNEELTNEDAMEQLIALLTLVRIAYKPMTQEEYDKLQQRRRETGDL